jgi:hypothetical protein
MNTVGWLAGGGSAPLVIGIIAQRESLDLAIALASLVYLAAGILLLAGIFLFVKRDASGVQALLEAEAKADAPPSGSIRAADVENREG